MTDENIDNGPLELRVAELEKNLASLTAYVASLDERLDEQSSELDHRLDEQIPVELKARIDALEADLRKRRDAEDRERLMNEACWRGAQSDD